MGTRRRWGWRWSGCWTGPRATSGSGHRNPSRHPPQVCMLLCKVKMTYFSDFFQILSKASYGYKIVSCKFWERLDHFAPACQRPVTRDYKLESLCLARFLKIFDMLPVWVHKSTKIITDFSISKESLNQLGFKAEFMFTLNQGTTDPDPAQLKKNSGSDSGSDLK